MRRTQFFHYHLKALEIFRWSFYISVQKHLILEGNFFITQILYQLFVFSTIFSLLFISGWESLILPFTKVVANFLFFLMPLITLPLKFITSPHKVFELISEYAMISFSLNIDESKLFHICLDLPWKIPKGIFWLYTYIEWPNGA